MVLRVVISLVLLMTAVSVWAKSPPPMPLPPCVVEEGRQTGACVREHVDTDISVSGTFGPGGVISTQAISAFPACHQWSIPDDIWTPSPCYSGIGLSEFGRTCGYIDLRNDEWKTTSCGNALFEDPQNVDRFWFRGESDVYQGAGRPRKTTLCFHSGNFNLYALGGPASDPEWIWSARGEDASRCVITYNERRPDGLWGPTWLLVGVQSLNRVSGSDNRQEQAVTQQWIPVDGDLRDFGPIAKFNFRAEKLLVHFDDESFHPVDETLSYAWDFGDEETSTAASPSHQFDAPGTYTVSLTVTDPSGDTDVETRQITVSGTPDLRVALEFADGRTDAPLPNENFQVTLRLSTDAGEGPISNIMLTDMFAGVSNLQVVSAPEIPADLSMAPSSNIEYVWTVRATDDKAWRLEVRASGTDKDGEEKSHRDALTVKRLTVEFIFPEDQVTLPEADDGGGLEPTEFPVRVKVTVLEGEPPVTNLKVGVDVDPRPLKIGKLQYVEETGMWVPVGAPIHFPYGLSVAPRPQPMPMREKTMWCFLILFWKPATSAHLISILSLKVWSRMIEAGLI